MGQENMQQFVSMLKETYGVAFVDRLYEYLKQEHRLEEAQLPPVPGRAIQFRPEHDIRSRLPKVRK